MCITTCLRHVIVPPVFQRVLIVHSKTWSPLKSENCSPEVVLRSRADFSRCYNSLMLSTNGETKMDEIECAGRTSTDQNQRLHEFIVIFWTRFSQSMWMAVNPPRKLSWMWRCSRSSFPIGLVSKTPSARMLSILDVTGRVPIPNAPFYNRGQLMVISSMIKLSGA